MASNPYRINGLGVRKSYLSDSDYTTQTGTVVRPGDIYRNTTRDQFRFFNGTSWRPIISSVNRAIVRAYDDSTVVVPSGPQTVDGVSVIAGDLVLMSAVPTPGIYEVDASTWILRDDLLSDPSGALASGDEVWVKEGTANANLQLVFDGIGFVGSNVANGTVQDSLLHWDTGLGSWIESILTLSDAGIFTGVTTVKPADDSVNDANPATSLNINAGAKTAGTGDGGDLYLSGGLSAGGFQGSLFLSGNLFSFTSSNAGLASISAGDINFISSTGLLKLTSDEVRHSDSASTAYFQEEMVTPTTLLDNQTDTVLFSFPIATWGSWEIEYQILASDASFRERRRFTVVHNTTAVNFTNTGTLSGISDVSLNAVINGANIDIRYTTSNLSITRTMRAKISKIPA